jgi:hypothetical protein
VVIVFDIEPKFASSDPEEDDGFLREIKILNMTSFGEEVKPSVPCGKSLRQVKNPCGVRQRYFT